MCTEKIGWPSGPIQRIRSVFLFTDGVSTTGLTAVSQLTPVLAAMLSNPIRPNIYTFGFGNHVDDTMLNAISEEGQGQSIFIGDAESIPSAFASALGALMSMAAQNLEIDFMPEVFIACLIPFGAWQGNICRVH